MGKKIEVHGHDLEVKVVDCKDGNTPGISIQNSKIDFNAQPEKVLELMKVLGIGDDVTVEVRVSTASTIVE